MALAREIPIEWLEEVDSTNIAARRWVESYRRGADERRVFVARRQTAGVGRHGRKWHSPEGGLWCSAAWALGADAGQVLDALGLRIGIACWRTVRRFTERGDVRLKWPNDVLIDGKKACGCLVESFVHEGRMWLVVGVGVNVANAVEELPDGLRTPPVSLNMVRERPVGPDDVLPVLLDQVARAIAATPAERAEWFAEAGRSLHGIGAAVQVRDGGESGYRAVLSGLSSEGRLRVRRGENIGDEVVLGLGTAIEYE